MKAMRPTLLLGPGAMSQPSSQEYIESLLTATRDLGIDQIDASPVRPDQSTVGNSERALGLAQASSKGFKINTAVESDAQGRCPLNRGQIWQNVEQTLRRLDTSQVDVLYIHPPDSEALLDQQAAAMDDLFRQGKFRRLGLVDFSIPTLKDYLLACRRRGYALPSVYLLTYNLVWRFPEPKLVPFLRENGIALVARGALAGGLLTGRFAPEQLRVLGGGEGGRRMYGRPCFQSAAADLVALVSPRGVGPAEAALRWLCYHSELGGEDGVVLGATTVEQLRDCVAAVERGPLPEELVAGIERIWEGVREGVRR
ncbi:Aldo/keto reductase [Coniochaeta hoffmannii]|uniref:Aldo/keto reductase n=1 Tax=Coniochaeta hoffmannii TaxID=91930 RepID=A0AA38VHC2_9PEZI|nr:Aldo/keto reductase [Coniochaeta hoffmannii]